MLKGLLAKAKKFVFGDNDKGTSPLENDAFFSKIKSVIFGVGKLPMIISGCIFGIILFMFLVVVAYPEVPAQELFGTENGSSSNGNYSGDLAYLQWAIDIANDDTHGYSQCSRFGPDYDCASLVYYSLYNTGYKDQIGDQYPWTTTGIRDNIEDIGFERHDYVESELQAGDILWLDGHTGIYAGDGKVVQASSSREGNGLCGKTGDQDGTEVWISDNYNAWTAYYRKKG